MGRAHSNAFRKVSNFFDLQYQPVLKAVCGREEAKVKAFATRWGYESTETDWRKLIARKDIDVVDIACPNDMHKDIALAAAKAGKMILCEKPLAMNGPEGLTMVKAIEKAGVPNMVWYNYRRVPSRGATPEWWNQPSANRFAFSQGGAGLWRLDVKVAGSGVTGDLLAHCIDTAVWLNGSIDKVNAMTETFVKERKHTLTGKVEKVGIDDACAFLARFENGSLATFESTRYARGHKALYTFEINGEHASIGWDLHDLHRLQYFDHRDEGRLRGWRSIHISDSDHPYMGKWWVPGLQIGYEHTFVHQVADFFEGVAKGKWASPTFRDALETQYVCDAVLKSAKTARWEKVQTNSKSQAPNSR